MTRTGQDRIGIRLRRPPRDAHHLRARHHQLERLEVHNLGLDLQVRSQARPQRLELLRIGGPDAEQLGIEADRVLDRVKALEHDEFARPPGLADVCELHR